MCSELMATQYSQLHELWALDAGLVTACEVRWLIRACGWSRSIRPRFTVLLAMLITVIYTLSFLLSANKVYRPHKLIRTLVAEIQLRKGVDDLSQP